MGTTARQSTDMESDASLEGLTMSKVFSTGRTPLRVGLGERRATAYLSLGALSWKDAARRCRWVVLIRGDRGGAAGIALFLARLGGVLAISAVPPPKSPPNAPALTGRGDRVAFLGEEADRCLRRGMVDSAEEGEGAAADDAVRPPRETDRLRLRPARVSMGFSSLTPSEGSSLLLPDSSSAPLLPWRLTYFDRVPADCGALFPGLRGACPGTT